MQEEMTTLEQMRLGVGHTSTREKSRWMQIGLHCQFKLIWVSGSLKGKIRWQKLHVHELDYVHTFSPVTKMTSMQIMVS